MYLFPGGLNPKRWKAQSSPEVFVLTDCENISASQQTDSYRRTRKTSCQCIFVCANPWTYANRK